MRYKTRDGLRIKEIVNLLQDWGIDVKEGTKHDYVAYHGTMRPCPIAASTDAKRMLSPWLSRALGMGTHNVYKQLQHNC